MPAPRKPVRRRVGLLTANDVAFIARYFASAGCDYPRDRPPAAFWLPWSHGAELRAYWTAARAEVKRLVPPRAFELFEMEFALDGEARQVEHWSTVDRRELYALCKPTGCLYWVDEDGNSLPHGVRSMATYAEDLARLRKP